VTLKATKCRGTHCDESFFWVECVRRNGSTGRVPLDMDPLELSNPREPEQLRGKFVFIEDEVVRAAVAGDIGPFFVSHYSTCVDAEQFRGKK